MAEQLGLSADQKDQVKKVHDEYQTKIDALEKERRAAVEKLLTIEQQTKLQELMKQRRGNRGNPTNNENNNNNNNQNNK
jgi:Spy/CpxP family protein refolding chaperone